MCILTGGKKGGNFWVAPCIDIITNVVFFRLFWVTISKNSPINRFPPWQSLTPPLFLASEYGLIFFLFCFHSACKIFQILIYLPWVFLLVVVKGYLCLSTYVNPVELSSSLVLKSPIFAPRTIKEVMKSWMLPTVMASPFTSIFPCLEYSLCSVFYLCLSTFKGNLERQLFFSF